MAYSWTLWLWIWLAVVVQTFATEEWYQEDDRPTRCVLSCVTVHQLKLEEADEGEEDDLVA